MFLPFTQLKDAINEVQDEMDGLEPQVSDAMAYGTTIDVELEMDKDDVNNAVIQLADMVKEAQDRLTAEDWETVEALVEFMARRKAAILAEVTVLDKAQPETETANA